MEIFRYTKLASETGKSSLIGLAIFAAFAAFIIYREMSKSGDLSNLKVLVFVGIFALLIVAAKDAFNRFNSKGLWEIIVDDKTVQWNGPDLVDESFIVNLDQIDYIERLVAHDGDKSFYTLIMKDTHKINLNRESQLNFEEFIKALQARGVDYKEKRRGRNYK